MNLYNIVLEKRREIFMAGQEAEFLIIDDNTFRQINPSFNCK